MISRDTVIPIGLLALFFVLAIGLVLAGHRSRLNERISDHSYKSGLIPRVVELHDAASSRTLSLAAAHSIARGNDLSGAIERIAFRILFEMGRPETAAKAVLQSGSFVRGLLQIRGIDQMADVVFGTEAGRLSDGELGLYCNWAAHGQQSWRPDDILDARRQVIDRMFERGAITAGARDSLKSKSLALRPTPVPID